MTTVRVHYSIRLSLWNVREYFSLSFSISSTSFSYFKLLRFFFFFSLVVIIHSHSHKHTHSCIHFVSFLKCRVFFFVRFMISIPFCVFYVVQFISYHLILNQYAICVPFSVCFSIFFSLFYVWDCCFVFFSFRIVLTIYYSLSSISESLFPLDTRFRWAPKWFQNIDDGHQFNC